MNDVYNPNINNTIQDMDKIKEENKTKAISRFRIIGIPSLLYGFICAISLYKAYSGIFSVFAVIATVCYTLHAAHTFNKKIGKFIYFNCTISILLSISNFITGNEMIIFFNYCGILLLTLVNGLYLFANLENVSFTEHIKLLISTAIKPNSHIASPIGDLISSRELIKVKKDSKILYVILGIIITIPTILLTGSLLSSADKVFSNSFESVLMFFDFDYLYEHIMGLAYIAIATYLGSYLFVTYLSTKEFAPHKGKMHEFEPIIAIIVNSSISLMYMVFCAIQVYYLFFHAGTLPENYTYAEYAREGFFQLLCVCFLNVIIVLICNEFFKGNKVLSYINVAISICTFIMIASSAYRMLMYINEYGLSTTRIFVLWFLMLLVFIMTGLTIQIKYKKFNFFKYSVIITSMCYLLLSFGHIDYFIAYYNFNMYDSDKLYRSGYDFFDNHVDIEYISNLSTDAAPVIHDHYDEFLYSDMISDNYYYNHELDKVGIRNFNVSHYIAKYLLEENLDN